MHLVRRIKVRAGEIIHVRVPYRGIYKCSIEGKGATQGLSTAKVLEAVETNEFQDRHLVEPGSILTIEAELEE